MLDRMPSAGPFQPPHPSLLFVLYGFTLRVGIVQTDLPGYTRHPHLSIVDVVGLVVIVVCRCVNEDP